MDSCLAVDIGNSGLRIAALDTQHGSIGEPLRIRWRHSDEHATNCHAPGEASWLIELQEYVAKQASSNCRWYVSSVRGDAMNLLEDFVRLRPRDRWHPIVFSDVPMTLRVEFPERLGIDRLLAAWAATNFTPSRPYVVIQAGSAVTVDLVSTTEDGHDCFEGGAILPGVPMIMRLLGKAADMLPEIVADDLTDLPALPGRNTEAAMTCGAASALVGGVQHLVNRYRMAFGDNLPVILSGGDGMRLSPYLGEPLVVQPHLVLRGLLMIAQGSTS